MFTISHNRKSQTVPVTFNVIASKCDPQMFFRMLWSIQALADQIVVVFDEKAGGFLYEIARQFTDDILYAKWPHSFARQRNIPLAHSQCDYISWIDTDEWYHPAVADRVRGLLMAPRGKAFYIWQVSPSDEGSLIFVPQVRLFPNIDGVKWEISIHEQILPSLERIGVKTELTDLRIEHSGYVSREDVIRKNRRNLRMLRRAVRKRPGDMFTRSNYHVALQFEKGLRRRGMQ